ncbi:hypothetical protein RHOSPDRAFT_27008 [Rhodotorula sp. JG-1b]|nr:hypothetical protein RHOSPDRAFT_27008 [Rhodotorula sp. JG-1b]
MLSATTFSRRLTRLARPPLASLPAVQRSTFYHKAPAMSLLESRRRVVPSLWDRVFRKEWDDVEKMLAPGFTFEVMPDVYRPLFSGLPRTGVFDPSETIDYLKQVRDKMLAEPKSMNVTDQSMGENSLQTRFVTSGIDKDGKPYDIKHSLFLEFDNKDSDKIKRGVEYLESDSMNMHLKREEGKDWQPLQGAAQTSVEGHQQAQVEGAKQSDTTLGANQEGGAAPAAASQSQGKTQSS